MEHPTSVVFLTTPTSGTSSLWSMLTTLCANHPHKVRIPDYYGAAGRSHEVTTWKPEVTGYLYMYNTPQFVNESLGSAEIKLIVNFRDPRDMACNQFYWAQQHPSETKNPEELERYRNRVREEGIDKYAIRIDNNIYFKTFEAIRNRLEKDRENTLVISYSQLCLDFDAMVNRIAVFLGIEPERIPWDMLAPMRADNLPSNPAWIGQQWAGSDATPGRFRTELTAETIAALNDRYREVLEFLRPLEAPHLQHFLECAHA